MSAPFYYIPTTSVISSFTIPLPSDLSCTQYSIPRPAVIITVLVMRPVGVLFVWLGVLYVWWSPVNVLTPVLNIPQVHIQPHGACFLLWKTELMREPTSNGGWKVQVNLCMQSTQHVRSSIRGQQQHKWPLDKDLGGPLKAIKQLVKSEGLRSKWNLPLNGCWW